MIAPMKWVGYSLRGLNTMRRMQWMLSMLAIVGCLWSVANVHSHDDGLHVLESACISCDLEDIASHGAAVTIALRSTPNLSYIEPVASQTALYVAVARVSAPIRAPPVFS
jgi:hypothetical protein